MIKNLKNNNLFLLIITGVLLLFAFIFISYFILNLSFFSNNSQPQKTVDDKGEYTTPDGNKVYYDSSYYNEDDVKEILDDHKKYVEQ